MAEQVGRSAEGRVQRRPGRFGGGPVPFGAVLEWVREGILHSRRILGPFQSHFVSFESAPQSFPRFLKSFPRFLKSFPCFLK